MVEGGRALQEFVRLPRELYRGLRGYSAPLDLQKREELDRRKNPYFAHAEAAFWLARREGRPVGRISAQIDRLESSLRPGVGHFGLLAAMPLARATKSHRSGARLPKSANAITTQQAIVELKPVSPEDYFLRKAQSSRSLYWIKSRSQLPDDALTQQCALAYLSDYFLTPTVVLQHTVSMMTGQVMMASLDHAMWFHRPCRADQWVLVDAISPFAGGARGLTRAQIYDRERRLVASVAQEGLVRPLEKKSA